MNYLHSQYKKAGKISNQDFLYTLSVCASEPIRFIRLYEWRELNEMEINAIGCFWKGMGDAMGIEYRGYLSKDSWVDGTDFLDDMLTWAKRYEIDSMKPSHINTVPAYSLVDMLLYQLSGPVKAFVIQVLTVLMGDRMREAFLYVYLFPRIPQANFPSDTCHMSDAFHLVIPSLASLPRSSPSAP